MAELKHTFVKGRMNKDLDERLIPNGEYRDALNIQVSSSEGSDAGAIENVLGNEKVFDLGLTNATCIGTAKDPLSKKIYWFVTSDELNGIYEYDIVNNIVDPILIDTKKLKELTINTLRIDPNADGLILRGIPPNQQSEIFFNGELGPAWNSNDKRSTQVLCHNNVRISSEELNLKLFVPRNTVITAPNFPSMPSLILNNINYTGEKLYNKSLKFKYFTESLLNFDSEYFILGANIIDGLLFFTDGLNEPKVIDIEKFKSFSNELKNDDGTISKTDNTRAIINDPNTSAGRRVVNEEDICVAKKAPQRSPRLNMKSTLRDGVVTSNGEFNFYKNGGLVLPSNEDPTIKAGINLFPATGWKEGDIIIFDFEGEGKEYEATLKINSIELQDDYPVTTYQVLSYSEQPENKDYENVTATLKESDPIYELKFPRFAYRWKYLDNTYSAFSPFSPPAFMPGDFEYDGKKGFNEGVVNNLRKLTLENIPKGDDTVKSIDILLKFDDDNNVYIVDTVKRKDINTPTLFFEITKETIKSTVPNIQLLRQWDNVPKKALTQEIVGNRVIYGNYYQNYDVPFDPNFSVAPVITDGLFKRSIKSNRNYEIGVVYVDKFNRQTPVLSNNSGSYFLDKSFANKNTALSVKLNNLPPAWATHFKYFIKETSAEYYNMGADRYYQDDENGFTYISFPSSERNKINEDSYIILKKKHGVDEPVIDANNRFKVIDIFSEPPEFITNRKRVVYSLGDIVFTDNYAGQGGGNTITNRDQTGAGNGSPVEGFASFQMKAAGAGQENGNGVPPEDAKELKAGRFIKFTFGDKESNAYEIKSVQQHPSGVTEVKVTVTEPFEDDVNIIYSKVAPFNLGEDSSNLGVGITILEEYSAAGDEEFDGRFFVKLQTNSTLSDSIVKETVGDKSYLIKQAIALNGVYSGEDGRDDGRKYKDKDRTKRTASRTPPNPFIVSHGGTAIPGSNEESGKRINFGGELEYNITLEQATHRSSGQFLPLAKLIKSGDFVRFKKPDGELHHETIYEIGAVRLDKFNIKVPGTDYREGLNRISIAFIDEDGNFKPLDEDVCKRNQNTIGEEPIMEILQELNEENIFVKDPAIFETEPVRQKTELDIYYEDDTAYPISEHSNTKILNWYNCFNFNNGVESNRIRDDFNAPFIKNGVKASTVLEEGYQEEHKFNGLIWSGIINSKSSVNNSNQFIQAETITKDFLPSYGKIQKLHTWDNAMVIFLENKVLRVYANKSQLFDANGNGTLTSTNRVIGDAQEYNGEYGISNDPQSFAAFGFRCYFVDRKNGKVLRLSKDGLTPISNVNMNDFFRDRLATKQAIFGSFDERNKIYNISFTDEEDTVCFSESVNGWVTRKSFVPQNAVSINSKYFTFNNGNLWQHASTVASRNNFYGEQGESFVQFEINEDSSAIKRFKTLSYEGSKDWVATVETNEEKSSEISFINKEGKYFSNIKGEVKFDSETASNLDLKKFNFQGIGKSSSQDVIEDNRVRTTLSFKVSTSLTGVESQTRQLTNLYPGELINQTTVSVEIKPSSNNYKLIASDFSGNNCTFTQNGDKVIVTYTHGITRQPTTSKIINIPIQGGRLIQKTIDVTVTRNVVTNNCTSSIGPNTFTITGVPEQVYEITSDIISANEGFNLPASNVSIDNSQINANSLILQSVNGLTEVQTNESIPIENGMTAVSYTITANAEEIIIPNKLLTSKSIEQGDLLNTFEQRSLQIIGQAGAIVRYTLNDGSSNIAEETITISDTGRAIVNLDFTATDYNVAKTYTLTFSAGNKTEFNESFGSKELTFTRNAKAQKKLTIKAYHTDSVNNAVKTKIYAGFGGQEINSDIVEFEFTLNSSFDYGIISQPASTNFIFEDGNLNEVSISDVLLSVDDTNEHIVTLKFTVDADSIDADQLITIQLADFVNKKITLTIGYNDPNQGADYNGSFIDSISTIEGIAGSPNSDLNAIKYKITMVDATKQLLDGDGEDALRSDEFKLFDAQTGGNDVTETYDDNNLLLLEYNDITTGATITLQPSSFTFPDADATLYIRPSRTITENIPAAPPNDFYVRILGLSPLSEIYPNEEGTQSWIRPVFRGGGTSAGILIWPDGHFENRRSANITETSSVAGTKRLVQFVYDIDRTIVDGRNLHISKWAPYSNNNYSLLQENSDIIEEAVSGTYTAIDGNSVTVTGPYVISNDSLRLTVNLLVDIQYVTTNSETLSELVIRTPIDHRPSAYITSGTDIVGSSQFAFDSKTAACDASKNSILWKVYNTDGLTGEPKVGSFISGRLTPITGPIQIPLRLGQHYKNPRENQYFKDFTNSKIYQLDDKGVIVQIMDLCVGNTGLKDLLANFSVSTYGNKSKVSLQSAVSDVPIDSQSGNNAINRNFIINSQSYNEYNQLAAFQDNLRFRFRINFLEQDSFEGRQTISKMSDYFNPEYAFKFKETSSSPGNVLEQRFVTMTDTYAEYDITLDTLPNLKAFYKYYIMSLNPKSNDPHGEAQAGANLFNLQIGIVTDFPATTNVSRLSAENFGNLYTIDNIRYVKGFG